MGEVLARFRRKATLILGSGGIVHNLHRLRLSAETHVPDPWARGFDNWTREQVGRLDAEALCDYRRRAPHALESVPTPEHFEPLLFVLGAALPGDRVHDLYEGFRYGSLSMRTFVLAGRRRDEMLGIRIASPRP